MKDDVINKVIKVNIRKVFAMPEQEQAAEWEHVIEITERAAMDCKVGGKAWRNNKDAIAVYQSIASEAKYFA